MEELRGLAYVSGSAGASSLFAPSDIFARLYGVAVRLSKGVMMDSVSVNKFRDNLKTFVEQVVTKHVPLKVTRRSGEDFMVISADDWEREQETLYVLQSQSLMQQIAASLQTHNEGAGYQQTQEEIDEITGI